MEPSTVDTKESKPVLPSRNQAIASLIVGIIATSFAMVVLLWQNFAPTRSTILWLCWPAALIVSGRSGKAASVGEHVKSNLKLSTLKVFPVLLWAVSFISMLRPMSFDLVPPILIGGSCFVYFLWNFPRGVGERLVKLGEGIIAGDHYYQELRDLQAGTTTSPPS